MVSFSRFLAASQAGEFLATDPVPGTMAIIDIAGAFKENFALVQRHLNSGEKSKLEVSVQTNKERIDKLILDYEATITNQSARA